MVLPAWRVLAPARGYSADFLTPAEGVLGLEAGLQALLSTPKRRLRADVRELSHSGALPGWAKQLAEGASGPLHELVRLVRWHHEHLVAPYWPHIRQQFNLERSAAARTVLSSGSEGLFSRLHPSLRWASPVLHVTGAHVDGDLHLSGRGIRIIPSFFCWPAPTVIKDQTLTPVLVYPVAHDPRWLAAPDGPATAGRHTLSALLGRARAAVLDALGAVADGLTTSEVAVRAGISPATASHHTSVLREAGLIATRRNGGAVLHTPTPMGLDLLHGCSSGGLSTGGCSSGDVSTGGFGAPSKGMARAGAGNEDDRPDQSGAPNGAPRHRGTV
ncbi:ArsR/SmtB family transcription factor [Streptomyces sp. NPDC003011]